MEKTVLNIIHYYKMFQGSIKNVFLKAVMVIYIPLSLAVNSDSFPLNSSQL